MHLTESTVDTYLARELDRHAMRSVDDHTASCLACAIALESTALDDNRWERRGLLGRLARVRPQRAAEARGSLDHAA
jgi:hypothetical protein